LWRRNNMATPISKVTLTIDNKDYLFGLQQASNQTKTFANDATTAFNRADAASNKFNLSANNLTGGLVKLRGTLATIGLGAFAASALQGADAVADLSDSTQISVGKILEFQKALQLAGGDANDAGKSLGAFYASIDEANQGSDKTQETFRKLGVSLKDLRTLSEEDLLDKTIKGFRNLSDPIQRQTTLVNIFGKAMRTVEPGRLGEELENLRGTLGAQEGSVKDAADAIEQFEGLVNALKGAVVLAINPLLQFFGQFKDGDYDVRAMAGTIQSLAAAYVALRVAAFSAAIAQAAVGAGLKGGVAGVVTGVAAAALTFKGLQELMDQAGAGPQPGQQGPAAGLGPNATMADAQAEERRIRERRNRDTERRNREQQIGKELEGQLNAVNSLVSGYQRASQANMDRYTMEVDILGKTEDEIELIRGRGEIEKKYADQTAALEDKKKGAKGQTLALIQQSLVDLDALRTSEIDIFEITRGQITNYRQRQEEIKRSLEYSSLLLTKEQEAMDSLSESINTILTGSFKKMREEQDATANKSLPELQRRLASIAQEERNIAEAAKERIAAQFENDPEGLLAAQRDIEEAQKIATERRQAQAEETYNQQRQFSTGWAEAYQKFYEDATNASKIANDTFNSFTSGLENSLVRLATTGKLSFKDLANSIIGDLARIYAKQMIVGLFGKMGEGGASSGGILSNVFNAFSGLFKAEGGPVSANRPYIIGEKGAELFIPRSSGNIIPNNKLAMGGGNQPSVTNVNYNIQAVDASSFRSLVARDPSFIYAVTEQGRRSQPTRR
jgi:hypothetical protein